MIKINGHEYTFGKKGITVNGQSMSDQQASFLITGVPCVGGAGIFSALEAATFSFAGSPRKVYFGKAVNYKKLEDEREIVKLIRRRVEACQKVCNLKPCETFDFHEHTVTAYRVDLNTVGAAAFTEELTGAEFVDGHGIFTSDRQVTVEAYGQKEVFDFSVLGLALYDADEIADVLECRLNLIKDWVESVKPVPAAPAGVTFVINIMEA